MKAFARIAVNVPGVRGFYDYRIPEELLGDVQKGSLVEVPFGAQTVQGIVTQLLETPGVPETKAVANLIADLPVLTHTQMALAEFLSERYLAPISEYFALMLPPGLSQRADTLYTANLPEGFDLDSLSTLQRRIIQRLRERGPQRGRQLENTFRHADWRRSARALARRGLVISQPVLPEPRVRRKMTRTAELSVEPGQLDEALENAGRAGSAARERRQAILRLLAVEGEDIDVSYIYASTGGNSTDLRYLDKKGYIRFGKEEVMRDPLEGREIILSPTPTLTADQQAVWKGLEALYDQKRFEQPVLLHGVTGSGKTELYMRAIEKALAGGRQAIMLVPEISLTPQTIERFTSRFGRQVGVIHSKLSEGERYDTWRRAREADFRIAIGARSALFIPFPDTGVIGLDEFHDESFIQTEISPYYSAVEAAIEMGRLENAQVILGSATPDVGIYHRAQREEWPIFDLPHRILAHGTGTVNPREMTLPLPEVSVVDMRAELRQGNTSIFSRELIERVSKVLSAGEQAILLLNRRGSATWVFCRDCGFTLKCPRCDLPLTWHSGPAKLVCHTCGYSRKKPGKCPECGSGRIKQFGTGTEKVESELQKEYPNARLLRWDADTARGKGAEEVILRHFKGHNADILIGTQMVAKGLDLPLVTLVGVVLADVGLNFPDYRAAERSFQLLAQVAGRAGRSERGGHVVVQTFQPEHYAIHYAAAHDFHGFFEEELRQRRELRYPPFTRIARFEARALKNDEARELANIAYRKLQRLVRTSDSRNWELRPPVPPYFARRSGYYRWQVILKGSDPARLLDGEEFPGVRVEMDPPSLL